MKPATSITAIRDQPATMKPVDLHAVLDETASAIRDALGTLDDWGLANTRPGQYLSDVAADRVAVDVLVARGLGVLSEETGRHHPERDLTVVVDQLDVATNAAGGVRWYGARRV